MHIAEGLMMLLCLKADQKYLLTVPLCLNLFLRHLKWCTDNIVVDQVLTCVRQCWGLALPPMHSFDIC